MALSPSFVFLAAAIAGTVQAVLRGGDADSGMYAWVLGCLVIAVVLSLKNAMDAQKHWNKVYAFYPKQYTARRGTIKRIDGDVFKDEWEAIPWSDVFEEIRGPMHAPVGSYPTDKQSTRMKMMWDDRYLYIAAMLDYDAGDKIVAEFTERNSAIFQKDSDFEVFIDPAGCCHGYKELELNAINTVWNLMLNRPYSDGGGERSGRVAKEGEADYWEVRDQKTAARIDSGNLQGSIVKGPARWCCELALSHADTLGSCPVKGPQPKVGNAWRINFSRVEKKGDVNWVWSPQVVWTPAQAKRVGQVNMHLPDAWGYVVFADDQGFLEDGSDGDNWKDPSWSARYAAASLYYATKEFIQASEEKALPEHAQQLMEQGFLAPNALEDMQATLRRRSDTDYTWEVASNGWLAEITQDRLLKVRRESPPS
eukprot:TRINITY_DN40829_c0_g1_i1.p1 TRINITY_DN40829_c0_g1~~TRINITY_DN40829_c0_g1_i1.p1  ORF type:complete len:456 (-),score=109.69 TRINITY_DN40829_c0_g1_i1:21-1289(-)